MPARRHRTWLGLVAAFPVLAAAALWNGGPAATPAAAQGIPDAGAQQQQIIDQLKATNAKLDRLITLIGEGKIEVTLRKTEDAGRSR